MLAGSGVAAEGGTGVGEPCPGCEVVAGAVSAAVTPAAFSGAPAAAWAIVWVATGIIRIWPSRTLMSAGRPFQSASARGVTL